MSKFHLPTEGHERSYLKGELGSLGLSPMRIDELTIVMIIMNLEVWYRQPRTVFCANSTRLINSG
jgi:hypothetical protein